MASRPSSGSSETRGDDTLVEGDNGESRSAEVRCEVEMLCWSSDRRAAHVDGTDGRFSSFSSLESEDDSVEADCTGGGRFSSWVSMRRLMAKGGGLQPRRLDFRPPRPSFASTPPGSSSRLMNAVVCPSLLD